jgi:transposase InsO family protein
MRPWANGKAEQFNRTLFTEFAYARPWLSNTDRLTALDTWVTQYNTRRAHSALRGRPPHHPPRRMTVNNVTGQHS